MRRGLQGRRWPGFRVSFHCPLLYSHQDLWQGLEPLTSALAAVSAGAQKVAHRGSSVREAAALQQRYEGLLGRAKERQTVLENLLARWQR